MEIIATIGMFFKVALFMLDLWREKDREKARKKSIVAREIVNAFRETDKDTRVSRLNVAISNINRL